jgi:hypothetical protein
MRGAIPPLPQYAFMAWFSVKKKRNRGNFPLSSNFYVNEGDRQSDLECATIMCMKVLGDSQVSFF